MGKLSFNSTLTLASGNKIPQLGFGVAYGFGKTEDPAQLTKPSLAEALRVGYRHIDTAEMYHNEAEVGETIRESGIDRKTLFVTSKVASYHSSYDECVGTINQSLKALGIGYIDLYMIHDPPQGKETRLAMWKTLIEAKKQGHFKDIGVSNHNIHHLEQIREAGYEMPVVNQLELHPFCQQRPIVEYCQKHNIVVSAFCSIVRGALDHPVIVSIAKKHHKDGAQVLIRWSLQKGFVPLMRSSNPKRIKSNSDVFDFELDGADMADLDGLDRGAEGAISWNPIFVD